ncbi:Major facilitator superfamily MFS_1 [Devosia sp. LC5]|nr:Major facilitator superfamily MFS_1 [Devosia sp. LC5]
MGSSSTIIMTVAALAAINFAPDPSLATVPVTTMVIGLAVTTSVATRLIYRLGRSRGLILGTFIAIPAALLASLGVILANFYLFSLGTFLTGASGAFAQQIRFAAADSVAPDLKSRAISWVLFGGIAAGFFGPQASSITRNWIPGSQYAASFLVIVVLAVASIAILSQTRLAPTAVANAAGGGRPLSVLLRQPEIFLPMLGASVTYSLMTLLMVAAPLAMVYICGHSPDAASSAIQWHVVAMFAPSFVTGTIIRYLGSYLVTAIGLVLIIICAAIALSGISVAHFHLTLILLGLGWNFGFIGSTTMLATAYRPEEAARVQAVNEQIVFGVTAIASIGSGLLLQLVGWQAINILAIPLAAVTIALLAWGSLRRPAISVAQ